MNNNYNHVVIKGGGVIVGQLSGGGYVAKEGGNFFVKSIYRNFFRENDITKKGPGISSQKKEKPEYINPNRVFFRGFKNVKFCFFVKLKKQTNI